MGPWILIGLGLTLMLTAGFYFYRSRRRSRHRMISLVALVREPVTFDSAVLANIAGKVWQADLGDGTSEGADGFVISADPLTTIMHDGRMYLINSFPTPYTNEAESVAEMIPDLRVRNLFLQHQGWFSCDALGVDGTTSDAEIQDWYRQLGTLMAELLDDNVLLIYVPDLGMTYPINDETELALRSNDPIQGLRETISLPIVQIANDDPRMLQAVEKAKQEWPVFVAAFEAGAGENFSVKSPVTRKGSTEFIWISVTSLEGDRIYGTLANDPASLGSLKLGSKVSVTLDELNDWCYCDPQGALRGGFTIEAVKAEFEKQASRQGPPQ